MNYDLVNPTNEEQFRRNHDYKKYKNNNNYCNFFT